MSFTFLTGGSRGLGLAIAEQLQAEGQALIEFSRSAPHPFSVRADLGEPMAFRAAVLGALQALPPAQLAGGVLLIHNAGLVTPIGAAGDQHEAAVLANLQTNFSSSILGLAALVQALQTLPVRKRLLNISSGAALRPIAGWSLYCAAKAGLEHWIRCLDQEQRRQPHPWTAVNINPGVMDTGMQADIRASNPAEFPDHALFVQRHASGALQRPADVAARVLAIARRDELLGGERYDAAS